MQDGYLSAEEVRSMTQTPEIVAKAKELQDLAIKRNELKARFDAIENDVTEKLKGTGATASDKAQMIANARKLLLPEYNLAIDNYNSTYGMYTELKNESLKLLEQNIGMYGKQEDRAYQEAQSDKQLQAQKDMFMMQQEYANPDINSSNPQVAKIAAQKMVSDSLKFALENGIPVQRNAGQIIADAQKYAQGKGVTLAQAIQDTFTVPLTNKPEYKNAIQSIQLEKSPMFKFGLQKELKALDLANEKEMAQYRASLDPELAEKWEAVRQRATENISLGELLGDELGTYKKNRGVDLAGKMGDAIVAPPGAKVVEVRQANGDGTVSLARVGEGAMSAKDVGYGNSVLLQLPDGKYMRYSHLQDINVNLGDNLSGGVVVGTRGNTGNVRGKNGEKLTAEQLAAGRGAHVDVEI